MPVRFRPHLAVTLVVAPALALLCWLGNWQLERKVWKEDLIAKIDSRGTAPPMPLQDLLGLLNVSPDWTVPEDNEELSGDDALARNLRMAQAAAERNAKFQEGLRLDLEYRRIKLKGVVLPIRPVEFAVLDPGNVKRFLVPIKSEGAVVFLDVRAPEGQAPLIGAKTYDGEGVIRFSGRSNSFTPENDPAREQWFWPDVDAAAQARGLSDPAPFFLAVENPKGPPNPAAKPVLTANHLGYAFTWFGLAAGLFAVYLAWHHKNGRLSFGAKT